MTYSLVPNEKELNRSRAILGTVRTGLLPTYNMLPLVYGLVIYIYSSTKRVRCIYIVGVTYCGMIHVLVMYV